MRPISRVVDLSINTVSALLVDAGKACAAHHDATVVGVKAKRIQADEIWSFCYAKQKNVATAVSCTGSMPQAMQQAATTTSEERL